MLEGEEKNPSLAGEFDVLSIMSSYVQIRIACPIVSSYVQIRVPLCPVQMSVNRQTIYAAGSQNSKEVVSEVS